MGPSRETPALIVRYRAASTPRIDHDDDDDGGIDPRLAAHASFETQAGRAYSASL